MKTSRIISTALLVLGFSAWAGTALADTNDATCDVRKDGGTQHGKSGPCTFGQRQGYIDIDLKNGDTVSLSPAGGSNRYRDQNGNKVTQTITSNGMGFRWEGGKTINVTWGRGSSGNGSYGGHSSEYDRGYRDGQNGNWDQDSHNQDYKDGFSAGESAGGGHNKHSGGQQGAINPLDNGNFEVVFSKPFCSVMYYADGRLAKTSEECTDEQIESSRETARRRR